MRRALAADAPPKHVRPAKGSAVDAVEPQIRVLVAQWPTMPATVIAERVGWDRSITVLKDRVRELRPYYLPPEPASRTEYDPGDRVQCDLWFPPVDVPLGAGQVGSPPVLVMVAGYSRMIFAVMLPTRQAPDLLAGHWVLLQQMGAAPRQLVWDNEAAVGSWRAGKPKLTEEFEAFRGTLGIGVHQCRPRDPEAKGLVERANGYLETSFLPGRRFEDVDDFNRQLHAWLIKANNRIHATTKVRPREAMAEDRGAMLALPAVLPDPSLRFATRLARDHYVRVGTNDYSVNPRFVGRRVEVRMTLSEVVVTCEGTEVARHRRCLARHQSLLAADHARVLRAMRVEHQAAQVFAAAVEERDLADYDRALGVG